MTDFIVALVALDQGRGNIAFFIRIDTPLPNISREFLSELIQKIAPSLQITWLHLEVRDALEAK